MAQSSVPDNNVTVITTGGTIEKTYDEFDGTLDNKESLIKERILSKMRLPYTKIHVVPLFSKDSLFMTDEDRRQLVQAIESEMEKRWPIIILHGTDTMVKSANICLEKIPHICVPIIFTGAMRPLGFEDSDATQNVTEALMAGQILGAGVYISFHNRIFTPPRVRKNREKRTFESF